MISPTLPKKNVFAPFQMRRKKDPIEKRQWVLVFVNTSFFVIYSTIQAAKVLIAVCHSFVYVPTLRIYIDVIICSFSYFIGFFISA